MRHTPEELIEMLESIQARQRKYHADLFREAKAMMVDPKVFSRTWISCAVNAMEVNQNSHYELIVMVGTLLEDLYRERIMK